MGNTDTPKDKHAVHYSSAKKGSGKDNWCTPKELFDSLNALWRFHFRCCMCERNCTM